MFSLGSLAESILLVATEVYIHSAECTASLLCDPLFLSRVNTG